MLKKLFGLGKNKAEEPQVQKDMIIEDEILEQNNNSLAHDLSRDFIETDTQPEEFEPENQADMETGTVLENSLSMDEEMSRKSETIPDEQTDFPMTEQKLSSTQDKTAESTDETEQPKQALSDANIPMEEAREPGFFAKLRQGLNKTTQNFSRKINELFSGYQKIDDSIYEELEELLVLADLGFETAIGITEKLRERAEEKRIEQVTDLQQELENIIEEILLLPSEENALEESFPQIIVVVGVNGVGKTTSIGKLAAQYKNAGKSVMLAAGDTFRAAASEQLSIWASRSDVPIIRSHEGADPSAVIFDAIKSAQSKKIDVLICDTAGRLHNKANLMQELEKIFRIVNREYPEAKKEVFLVIDATTGQNAVNQAKTFSEVAPLTGFILTKLDGTAKGGVVIGISRELQVPIRYIGIGEGVGDLQRFDAHDFVKALFVKEV